MAKKESKQKKTISVSADAMEDFIWMSYRYCIGRHTIAANYHAGTIVNYLDILSEERREFMANDIRREVTDVLRWRSNFHIDGYCEAGDAFTIFLKYIKDNGISLNKDFIFSKHITINTGTGMVYTDPLELDDSNKKDSYYYDNLMTDIMDVQAWMKLANYLDKKCHKTVILNGEEYEAFPYYSLTNSHEVEECWVTCKSYREHPHVVYYIAPEYLKFKEE